MHDSQYIMKMVVGDTARFIENCVLDWGEIYSVFLSYYSASLQKLWEPNSWFLRYYQFNIWVWKKMWVSEYWEITKNLFCLSLAV